MAPYWTRTILPGCFTSIARSIPEVAWYAGIWTAPFVSPIGQYSSPSLTDIRSWGPSVTRETRIWNLPSVSSIASSPILDQCTGRNCPLLPPIRASSWDRSWKNKIGSFPGTRLHVDNLSIVGKRSISPVHVLYYGMRLNRPAVVTNAAPRSQGFTRCDIRELHSHQQRDQSRSGGHGVDRSLL